MTRLPAAIGRQSVTDYLGNAEGIRLLLRVLEGSSLMEETPEADRRLKILYKVLVLFRTRPKECALQPFLYRWLRLPDLPNTEDESRILQVFST